MEATNDLYQAILARRSVRRYAKQPLSAEALAGVRATLYAVQPLVPDNRFKVLVHDVEPGEDLRAALGGYGRMVSPPHYLVPYVVGPSDRVPLHPLTDLGYRVEQIAVRLTGLGIGSCYIGCLGREDAVRARFELPSAARVGAILLFGYPARGLGGRAFNALMHRAVGAANKLPAERIFFDGTFDRPTAPPGKWAQLVEAARNAPSAVNAQPWRFLWHAETLHLFVRRKSLRYGTGPRKAYRLYDGGICMGNVSLALEALGMAGRWRLYTGREADLPDHPADLQPLARLQLA